VRAISGEEVMNMFAVYATHSAPDDPLSALKIGERPEPEVPEGCE
jgi:hypothetical protein